MDAPQYDPVVVDGREQLVILEEGVWGVEEWGVLVESGLTPLRVVRPDAVLVWQPNHVLHPPIGSFLDAGAAEWKPGFERQELFTNDLARVLYEPRLPIHVMSSVAKALTAIGGEPLALPPTQTAPYSSSILIQITESFDLHQALHIPGILWIEPVLDTHGRNAQSAALHQSGQLDDRSFWDLGLNGSGVVLAVADGGLDADHSCFRHAMNATTVNAEANASNPALGTFGQTHRKIVALNTTLDSNDTPGHVDYRHGTHVAGTLVCFDVFDERLGQSLSAGTALGHGASLVFQDIVSEEGWVPPNVEGLLYEASLHGAIIHSNSWGDDTTAYTERTGMFDAYARAMPWSLAFIAPGNSGAGILEPANGRNVVSVGATEKSSQPDRWGGSAYGPTQADTDGLFVLATGASIRSANADGDWASNNNGLRPSSGTSMATPGAASAAGVIQQLYEDGWLLGPHESVSPIPLSDIQPPWSNESFSGITEVLLGDGFSPSGPMLRATMALATTPLNETYRNGGDGGFDLHNPYDGWGQINLSSLVRPDSFENENGSASPSPHVWVHDSYRLTQGTPTSWMSGLEDSSLEGVLDHQWNGSGAAGPFLSTGDVYRQRMTPVAGADLRVRLAFPAQPEPALVDDLQLRITLPNGKVMIPDQIQSNGEPTQYYVSVADLDNLTAFPNNNETTLGIDVPASLLQGHAFVDISVVARYVSPGNHPGTVGLDGNRVGFSLIVSGVERDAMEHLDNDGDGVSNGVDECPNEDSRLSDLDGDGCLDDDDGDGLANPFDACPLVNATGFDQDQDGCLDDSDSDGVTDNLDDCVSAIPAWPVNQTGCYPEDKSPVFKAIESPANDSVWTANMSVKWEVEDSEGDRFTTGAWLVYQSQPARTYVSCIEENQTGGVFDCTWSNPSDLLPDSTSNETFRLEVRTLTLNKSSLHYEQVVVEILSENITIDWAHLVQDHPDDIFLPSHGAPISNALLLMVGLTVGLVLMIQRILSLRGSRKAHAIPPPFSEDE